MMFSYQSQPFGNVCGQTVASMITGVPVGELINEIGRRKTWPKDMEAMLNPRGWPNTNCTAAIIAAETP